MAKKDNKSHHDNGIKRNYNRQENANSFNQPRDFGLNQQQISAQNLAQNNKEGNKNYEQVQIQLAESEMEFDKRNFEDEQ